MQIIVVNENRFIRSTNYWESELARQGVMYVAVNAGAFRLLLPDQSVTDLHEMRTGTSVVVSRGTWYTDHNAPQKDAFELLFEDGTDTPFSIHLTSEVVDRIPPEEDEGREDLIFLAYTRYGLQLELPAKYRRVKRLPCLKPWK